jgi:hypothetical protein
LHEYKRICRRLHLKHRRTSSPHAHRFTRSRFRCHSHRRLVVRVDREGIVCSQTMLGYTTTVHLKLEHGKDVKHG